MSWLRQLKHKIDFVKLKNEEYHNQKEFIHSVYANIRSLETTRADLFEAIYAKNNILRDYFIFTLRYDEIVKNKICRKCHIIHENNLYKIDSIEVIDYPTVAQKIKIIGLLLGDLDKNNVR